MTKKQKVAAAVTAAITTAAAFWPNTAVQPNKIVTLDWKWRGTNGLVVSNVLTEVKWTEDLRKPWIVATNTTANRMVGVTTNEQLFFKLKQL